MIVEFLPEATEEAEEARRRYAKRDPELALVFDGAVAEAIAHIKEAPDRWPQYMHGTQRYLLRRFPFAVVYVTEPGTVYVVAVPHHSCQPGYWARRNRLREL